MQKALLRYRDDHHFYDFKNTDLKKYSRLIRILRIFSEEFELQRFSLKEIDNFLWKIGKGLVEAHEREKAKKPKKQKRAEK